jgi:hypothetical protein
MIENWCRFEPIVAETLGTGDRGRFCVDSVQLSVSALIFDTNGVIQMAGVINLTGIILRSDHGWF